MKRKILAAALGAVMLLSLAGCSAGACSLCGSTENTVSYRNLSTNKMKPSARTASGMQWDLRKNARSAARNRQAFM